MGKPTQSNTWCLVVSVIFLESHLKKEFTVLMIAVEFVWSA